MRLFPTVLYALAVAALAACGGGSRGGALPPAASDPGTRAPSGSTVVFEKSTLWVGYDIKVNAFSTDGKGAVTPLATLPSFRWSNSIAAPTPGIVDVAIAKDGTKWVLENRDFAQGGPGWRLYAVAPGASTPENVEGDDVDQPFALALGDDGVLVGYRTNSGTTIATYPYGASNAAPLRSFQTTGPVVAFAIGNDGHFYLQRPTGVEVYASTATGCCPVRTIATGAPVGPVGAQDFAVGPDTSLYQVELPGNNANPVMYIDVFAPGSAKLARRIGPLPADYGGFGFPVITVDALNRLYVASEGKIYRFGPKANGTAAPQRVMNDPTQARARSMAVGPATL